MNAEKKRRVLFCLPVLLILFMLSGCSPIQKTAELFTAEPVPEAETRSVEEIVLERHEEAEKSEILKYEELAGSRAFYLLPAGVPLPGGVCSFTFLDFLSEDTTVYAYQILYALGDETGLGGMDPSGKKGQDDPIGANILPYVTEEMRNTGPFPREVYGPVNPLVGWIADRLVTILMTYNFRTEEYQVLFHDVEKVEPHYILDVDRDENGKPVSGSENVSLRLDNEIASFNEGRLDLSQMKAVRISSGEYALYYKEHIYRIDLSGTVKEERSVSKDLAYAMTAGSYGEAPEQKENELWHVEEFLTDADGTEWLLFQCVNEEEMAKEESETTVSSVRQFLLTSDEEKGTPFFTSENLAVNRQMDAFLQSDWTTVDFGHYQGTPSEKEILEAIGSVDSIRSKFPDQYDPYTMERENPDRIFRLSVPDAGGHRFLPGGEITLDPGWDWHVAVEEKVGTETAYSDAYLGPMKDPFLNFIHEEEYERHVRVTWEIEAEEEITNPDGTKEIRKVWKPQSMEYTDSMKFTFAKYCQLPVEKLSWYWNVPYEGALSAAPYQGIVQWNATDPDPFLPGNQGNTRLRWDAYSASCFKVPLPENGTHGLTIPYQTGFVYLEEESFDGLSEKIPVLYTEDPIVVNIFYNFEKNQGAGDRKWPEPFTVSKRDLSYKKQTNDMREIVLNLTEGSLRLRKESGSPWVYAASLAEGLTKCYAGTKEEMGKVRGPVRIWPYPCLRIYGAKDGESLFVFGFRSQETTFEASDLPFARIYQVNLFDEESCENIILSALENPENETYRWDLLNIPFNTPESDEAWESFYHCLGLGKESPASWRTLSEIQTKILRKWSGAMKFLTLCDLQGSENRMAIVGETLAANSVTELESIFVKYTKIHVPEEDEPEPKGKGEKPEDIERSRSVALEQWRTRIRLAKIRKLRESKYPPLVETAWEEELKTILRDMGKKTNDKKD